MSLSSTPSAHSPVVWEKALGGVILALLVILRWRATSRFRIDSDEPQHLHVVWAWTQGLLPYRDVFDNHTPLFHWFFSPILALLGERADILVAMRIAQFPLFGLTLWAIYALGRRLYDARVGWWAMVLTAGQSMFFHTSLEFRADVLWALLWVVTVLVMLSARGRVGWILLAGLLLGASLCASIKTALLVGSFSLGAGFWLLLQKWAGASMDWRKWAVQFGVLVTASLVVPLVFVSYFWARGGVEEMAYCLFHHNTGSAEKVLGFETKMLILPGLILVGLGVAGSIWRRPGREGWPFAKTFLGMGSAIYAGLLLSFWSLLTPVTNQDWLPLLPLLMVLLAACLAWLGKSRGCGKWLAGGMVFCFFLFQLLREPETTTPNPGKLERYIGNVLKLTEPEDYVMDPKGESIYRRRAYYFCLETQTRRKIIAGELADEIPARMVETRTALTRINRLPAKAAAFVRANYLFIGNSTHVLGRDLRADPEMPDRYEFEVAVPNRYVIVGQTEGAAGLLNGLPYTGPVELTAGRHQFIRTSKEEPLALFWARAQEKGFSAFAQRKSEEQEP